MDHELWFFIDLDLDEVAQRVRRALATDEPEFDAENLYEWFIVRTADNILLNFSRKHDDGDAIPSEPVRVMLAVSVPEAQQLARTLAAALDCRVHRGTVVYLGGDDFDFRSVESLDP